MYLYLACFDLVINLLLLTRRNLSLIMKHSMSYEHAFFFPVYDRSFFLNLELKVMKKTRQMRPIFAIHSDLLKYDKNKKKLKIKRKIIIL